MSFGQLIGDVVNSLCPMLKNIGEQNNANQTVSKMRPVS